MKTVIYYFTGTGNTLEAARKIAVDIEECILIPITQALKNPESLPVTEKIGIAFPLYFWGLPEIVTRFAEIVPIEKANYIFAVQTRGGSTGTAFHNLHRILKKRGQGLKGSWKITMPGNYVAMYNTPTEKKIKQVKQKMHIEASTIATAVNQGKTHKDLDIPFLRTIAKPVSNWWLKRVKVRDKFFHLDTNCNGCGACKKICPVQNISLTNNKPEWKHNCQQCFGCVNLCPQKSIQYKSGTAKRSRYINHDITIQDLKQQSGN